MLTRTYRDVGHFDRAVSELRAYIELLRSGARRKKSSKGGSDHA
jgi:hypothetical protein